jgi:hypothetical protein
MASSARERRIGDRLPPRFRRVDERDVDEAQPGVRPQRAVQRGRAEAVLRCEEVAGALPAGDERFIGLGRDLERVDQREGLRTAAGHRARRVSLKKAVKALLKWRG